MTRNRDPSFRDCPLLLTGALLLLFAAPATADCMSGPGSTGFQSGTQTYSVQLPNANAMTQIEGVLCQPNSGEVDPGVSAAGTGKASFIADYGGYSLHSSLSTGGETTGGGRASAGGTAQWTVRVNSQPGYSGPTTIDIDLTSLLHTSGAIQVSGPGSAGGAWNSEISIKPADVFLWTLLLVGSGDFLGASPNPSSGQATTSIDIDKDYVIKVFHHQSVTASGQSDPDTGMIGTAASSGTSRVSFGVEINPGFADPLLEVHFPIEDLPGGYAPFPGSAPLFPLEVPGLSGWMLGALALALLFTSMAIGGRTRLRSA